MTQPIPSPHAVGGGSGSGVDIVIRSPRVVYDGKETPASIAVRDGRIVEVGAMNADFHAEREVQLGDDVVVLPGLVDTHVHVCDPGTDWEGFESATRAAAAGGITTIVDMPIDSFPPTTTVKALEEKRASARGRCYIDVGFWGGAVAGNLGDMRPLRDNGVVGFKAFLIDPGVPDWEPLSLAHLDTALTQARDLDVPLLVHAELAGEGGVPKVNSRTYVDYLASRPKEMENRAIAAVIEAARRTGGRAHIVHLSSADALPTIASAKQDGVRITTETCPHYLTVSAEEIQDGATLFKCSPPIREAANREQLWQGLEQGIIDFIASDHAPCTVEMKQLTSGNFGAAWGGISSLQLSMPLVWTDARRRGHSLRHVARWMAEGPANFAGLTRKGTIAPGYDADFALVAPDETFVVDPARLYHRHPVTPYVGRELFGVVHGSWVGGRRVPVGGPGGRLISGRN